MAAYYVSLSLPLPLPLPEKQRDERDERARKGTFWAREGAPRYCRYIDKRQAKILR